MASLQDIVYEGFLERPSSTASSSKLLQPNKVKLWSVICGFQLLHFKQNKRSSCIGSTDLHEVNFVKKQESKSPGHKHTFEIGTRHKIHTYLAETEEECNLWITKLQQQMLKLHSSESDWNRSPDHSSMISEDQHKSNKCATPKGEDSSSLLRCDSALYSEVFVDRPSNVYCEEKQNQTLKSNAATSESEEEDEVFFRRNEIYVGEDRVHLRRSENQSCHYDYVGVPTVNVCRASTESSIYDSVSDFSMPPAVKSPNVENDESRIKKRMAKLEESLTKEEFDSTKPLPYSSDLSKYWESLEQLKSFLFKVGHLSESKQCQ